MKKNTCCIHLIQYANIKATLIMHDQHYLGRGLLTTLQKTRQLCISSLAALVDLHLSKKMQLLLLVVVYENPSLHPPAHLTLFPATL